MLRGRELVLESDRKSCMGIQMAKDIFQFQVTTGGLWSLSNPKMLEVKYTIWEGTR